MSGLLSSLPSSASPSGISFEVPFTDESGTLHEAHRGLVFVRDRYLGDFQIDPGSHSELRYRRFGVAYFCMECGEVWARVVLLNAAGKQTLIQAQHVSCENHLDQWNTPGSLLAAGLAGLIDLLPAEAVKREFLIYFKGEFK